MNYSKKVSYVIKGNKLKCSKDNHYNIKLDRQKFQIIKGTVYNQKQEPCKGAVIRVIEISCNDKIRSLLGYVITDENGEYLFSLDAELCMKYELTIYAPLS